MLQSHDKPVLFVDIDGVVSLFGFPSNAVPARCVWHQVDGVIHLLSHEAADHLLALAGLYEIVWCSGWEDRANDHLPHLLGLGPYPHLEFGRRPAPARSATTTPGAAAATSGTAATGSTATTSSTAATGSTATPSAAIATDGTAAGHWKLAAIAAHAGGRPLAWIDDDVNDAAREWARRREAPTIIVETEPATGLTADLAQRLRAWALGYRSR